MGVEVIIKLAVVIETRPTKMDVEPWNYIEHLGKPHRDQRGRHLGIARKGGGGLNPCPDGLGHFFREEFSKFKWAFP